MLVSRELFVCQRFNCAGDTPPQPAYASRVRITTDQAEKLRDQVNRRLRYFRRLRIRLEQIGYTPADPLYRAEHAAQGLAVAAHYDSCGSGVGRRGSGITDSCGISGLSDKDDNCLR